MDNIEWNDSDWLLLTKYIRNNVCTPFIGAGACAGILPDGKSIARQFAKAVDYPFGDPESLPRVAQYYDMMNGPYSSHLDVMYALNSALDNHPPSKSKRAHEVLAQLPFNTFMTTNYDPLMQQALVNIRGKDCEPHTEICRWWQRDSSVVGSVVQGNYSRPVVFHLHGDLSNVQSMVLTEDDYLQFLTAVTEREALIPANIVAAFRASALMFVGYSLEDISLRVLFQRLAGFMAGNSFMHVAVQYSKPPNATEADLVALTKHLGYVSKRLKNVNIRLFWGDCDEFAEKLHYYWQQPQKRIA